MKKWDEVSICQRAVNESGVHRFADQNLLNKLGPASSLGLAILCARHEDDLCSFLPKWRKSRG